MAMTNKQGLLSSGLSMVRRNKRYIVWFFLLNLLLGIAGTATYFGQANNLLSESLAANRLMHTFDATVFFEMQWRPEYGPGSLAASSATFFGLVFLAATALFLPGVFAGYGSAYRLPRDEFFRACGHNLW